MTAVLFQSMPPLSPEEYSALEQSIRDNGVQVPIVVDEAGVVIDGHHRQKITSRPRGLIRTIVLSSSAASTGCRPTARATLSTRFSSE